MPFSPDPVLDPSRLQEVENLLSDSSRQDGEFDRLTRLAAKMLRAPTCLVSLVTRERQEFKGACGLPGDLEEIRGTPLSHSICKLTVRTGQLVAVNDASADPRTAENPVVEAVGLQAYLGFPLMADSGKILGAFCVIDYVPRVWTDDEIDTVRDFAALAVTHLEAVAGNARIRAAFDVALHDLKTPLSGIVMASSLFSERIGLIPEIFHPLVKTVETSATAAVKLVETLGEEDQGSAGRICGNPLDVIANVLEKLQPLIDAKEVEVNLTSGGSRPLEVPPWVLSQMLENLISNSIKYGPVRGRVWIRFDVSESQGHFHVRDEGPGFTELDRKRMFLRYAKLSATPTGSESSTGLGLSIVKRLATQNGGTVELTSVPGEGAEFRVSFPLAES